MKFIKDIYIDEGTYEDVINVINCIKNGETLDIYLICFNFENKKGFLFEFLPLDDYHLRNISKKEFIVVGISFDKENVNYVFKEIIIDMQKKYIKSLSFRQNAFFFFKEHPYI